MSAAFKFRCSGCKATIVAPLYMVGAKTHCSQCGLSLPIPDPNRESFQATARQRDFSASISAAPLDATSWDDGYQHRASYGEEYEDRLSEYERAVKKWAMLIHLAQIFNFVFPCLGFVTQLFIWQLKQDELPEIDAHGKNALNWFFSSLLYFAVTLGFLNPASLALLGLGVIFSIIAALKANDDIVWTYPLSIRFLS